ncbi:MAG: hypothetical protein LUF92_15215 [Clostridiales bacterium]|nr:hypothetical protein [Clostridiales bacterium]
MRYQFDEAWQSEKGKQYVWFLESTAEDGVIDYNPINVYEGVYEVEGDTVERYSSGDSGNGMTRSAVLSDDKMELAEMESRISK